MSQVTTNGRACVPPLENGDRLSREEFERRYEAMPHVKKAELIDGVVYMGSPVRYGHHSRPNNDLGTFLGIYRHFTPGTGGGEMLWPRIALIAPLTFEPPPFPESFKFFSRLNVSLPGSTQ